MRLTRRAARVRLPGVRGDAADAEDDAGVLNLVVGIIELRPHAADLRALEGAEKLARLDSVATKGIKNGKTPLAENEPVSPANVKKLSPLPYKVREGLF